MLNAGSLNAHNEISREKVPEVEEEKKEIQVSGGNKQRAIAESCRKHDHPDTWLKPQSSIREQLQSPGRKD